MAKKLLTIIVLILAGNIAMSSVPDSYFKYDINHISVMDGLPHVDVSGIVQDKTGFIWIGTLSGLGRYDGYSVKKYNYGTTQDFDKNRITSVKSNSESILFIGTEGGLVVFNCLNETYINVTDKTKEGFPFINLQLNVLNVDSKNRVWVLSQKKLFRLTLENFSITKIEKFDPAETKQENFKFLDVIEDNTNNIWISTNKGVFYSNQSLTRAKVFNTNSKPLHLQDNYCANLYLDENRILCGGYSGVHIFTVNYTQDSTEVISIDFLDCRTIEAKQSNLESNELNVRVILDIVKDFDNNYWFGSEGGLLKVNIDFDNI